MSLDVTVVTDLAIFVTIYQNAIKASPTNFALMCDVTWCHFLFQNLLSSNIAVNQCYYVMFSWIFIWCHYQILPLNVTSLGVTEPLIPGIFSNQCPPVKFALQCQQQILLSNVILLDVCRSIKPQYCWKPMQNFFLMLQQHQYF